MGKASPALSKRPYTPMGNDKQFARDPQTLQSAPISKSNIKVNLSRKRHPLLTSRAPTPITSAILQKTLNTPPPHHVLFSKGPSPHRQCCSLKTLNTPTPSPPAHHHSCHHHQCSSQKTFNVTPSPSPVTTLVTITSALLKRL
jgi:hypothetical protein